MRRIQSAALIFGVCGAVLTGAIVSSVTSESPAAWAQVGTPLIVDLNEHEVQAHEFWLTDEFGHGLASLGAAQGPPALCLWDPWERVRAELGVGATGVPYTALFDEYGAGGLVFGLDGEEPLAIVKHLDGRYAWSAPADLPRPTPPATAPQPAPEPGVVLLPSGPAAKPPARTTHRLEYNEVRAHEFTLRDPERRRRINLYTSTEGGYPRAIFFDNDNRHSLMLSVNEGGECDVRFLDSAAQPRAILVVGPDAAGWALLGADGKAKWGFVTQAASFPPVEIEPE